MTIMFFTNGNSNKFNNPLATVNFESKAKQIWINLKLDLIKDLKYYKSYILSYTT